MQSNFYAARESGEEFLKACLPGPLEAESVRKQWRTEGTEILSADVVFGSIDYRPRATPQARYQLISKFRTATARAYYLTPEERTRMLATFVGKP
jgi:hypothetical protein